MPRKSFQLRLPNRTLLLGKRTLVMGILNVTPDSFSERGAYFDCRAAIARGLEMEHEGADILDIGGESTRPGAIPVEEQEELERTIPVIETLRRKGLRIPISIDTYKASVAERALRAGAEIVNDVSGLRKDARMASVVGDRRAAIIFMHMRGTPLTMQKLPPVRNILPAIRQGWQVSIRKALRAGISSRQIVLDPGLGFGKTAEQNFQILAGLSSLARMGYPLLVGPSRKSFIRKWFFGEVHKKETVPAARKRFSGKELVPEELLWGTAAVVAAAILNGAHIVRVHDVRQMVAVARIADRLVG